MYVAIKTNKRNMKLFFFFLKKARNGKLIKCIYLFPSKLTERHIAFKTIDKKTLKMNTVLKKQDAVVMEN